MQYKAAFFCLEAVDIWLAIFISNLA